MTSKIGLDSQLAVPPQVMSRLVGDETVLLDLAQGVYFGLDGVGMQIWAAVSAGQSLSQAASSIAAEYEVDEVKAQQDVISFVRDLVDRGLLYLD